ncbi:MAG: T9SS type A sorting domain-containing protein [Chitinophagales bacterium]|nr:T9SS type A sorting domain-containing protein [Chitinophagales bacterium]
MIWKITFSNYLNFSILQFLRRKLLCAVVCASFFIVYNNEKTIAQCISGDLPLIDDTQKYSLNSYEELDFDVPSDLTCITSQASCAANNSCILKKIVRLKDIPYVTYGKNQIYLGSSDVTYRMDLYFPSTYLSQTYNAPVVIFIRGGGFQNTNKDDGDIINFAKQFASKGFVVATFNYRTGHDAEPVQCANPANCGTDEQHRAIFRAVQDARLITRTIKAISKGDYKYPQPINYDRCLSLPFIDASKIIIGGTSAGAITALTTAYYSENDIDKALNNNNALGEKNVDWHIDVKYQPSGISKVKYYFPYGNYDADGLYTKAPINKIKAVLSLSGGVPERICDYISTPNADIGCSMVGGLNANLSLPKYVANTSSNISNPAFDYMPAIFFHGIEDPTVPYYNSMQNNIPAAPSCNYCPFTMIFGPHAIYERLISKGICSRLYGEAKEGHGAFVPSFVVNQSSIFIHDILCSSLNCSLYSNIEEDIKIKLISGSAQMNCSAESTSCSNGSTDYHATVMIDGLVKNMFSENPSAVVTQWSLGVTKLTQEGSGMNLLCDSEGYFNILRYDKNIKYYLKPGDEVAFTDIPVTIKTKMPIVSSKNYQITLLVKSPNEADYFYKGPGYTNAVLNDDKLSPIDITCPAKLGSKTLSTYLVEVYPNPANDNLNIQLKGNSLERIDITNSIKQAVYSMSTQKVTGPIQIDLSKFPAGIYLARFTGNNGEVAIKKFAVIR